MLTGADGELQPLRGCTVCETLGFTGFTNPDGTRERCKQCNGIGCVPGEPICAAPECAQRRLFASWFCAQHDERLRALN